MAVPLSSDAASILSSRTAQERTPQQVVADRFKDGLTAQARALAEISSPVTRAKVAVILLEQLSSQLLTEVRPQALGKLFTQEMRGACRQAIETFRTAFSLHPEVLRGFRETDPDFSFRYLLMRGLFYGRQPVPACDLKDTLTTFTAGAPPGPSFHGVRDAVENSLRFAPFYIVTGDRHEEVVRHFLQPNRWVREENGRLLPTSTACERLIWLPRTGMEIVEFDRDKGEFIRSPLVKGIEAGEVEPLRSLVQAIFGQMNVARHFAEPGRCYAHKSGWGPGTIEVRSGADGGNFSISSFPAGVLEKSARPLFKADGENAPFLEAIVCRLNNELATLGFKHVFAKRGGLSTIDLVTSDKGIALNRVRARHLRRNELLAFLGDRIALNGNDVEAIDEADVSVQVGNEWDPHLFPSGGRSLLRSKRVAAEGGAAEYLYALTTVARLHATGILAPDQIDAAPQTGRTRKRRSPLEGCQSPAVILPRDTLNKTLIEIRGHRNALLAGAQPGDPAQAERALALTKALDRISEEQLQSINRPLVRLELLLLKRVVKGQAPVVASDLKDTLAVFDAAGYEWFPRTRETFIEALRTGPYFLMTGDSLPNLRDRFLLPAGLVSRTNGHLGSELPGIYNLHLITRTGLDRVIFNFAKGELERFPLVPGIAVREVPAIEDILQRATELHHCEQAFAGFRYLQDCPPGYVERRGTEFGDSAVSFAYFPAGILEKSERRRFRETATDGRIFHALSAHIRDQLQAIGLDSILVQQGGISTLDLTTTTKGAALAQLRREMLSPNEFIIYIGDTVTQNGNDGSTVGIAEFTAQVGAEQDRSLTPPPGHHHIHSPVHARDGGTAYILQSVLRARKLAGTGLWTPPR